MSLQSPGSSVAVVTPRAAAAMLLTTAAHELADSISGPAAVVNHDRKVIFANRPFLSLARVRNLDDVLGRRLGELLGLIPKGISASGHQPATVQPVTEALEGRAASATSSVSLDGSSDGSRTRMSISAVPMRLRDQTFALVQFSPSGGAV